MFLVHNWSHLGKIYQEQKRLKDHVMFLLKKGITFWVHYKMYFSYTTYRKMAYLINSKQSGNYLKTLKKVLYMKLEVMFINKN